MAIQTSDLLLKLNPLGGLSSGSAEGTSSMERQRMRLLREQFEETKRQNALDNQYRQLHEQGEMARAQLGLQKQREQAEALAAAELTKNKQDIYKKFSELNGSGDIEGARALVPYMTSLGMQVDLEGEDGGLPRYRIAMDEKAAQQEESARAAQTSSYGPSETAEQSLSRLGGMGYPEDDSGVMSEPAGIGGEEALGRAQAASDYAELSGRPAREADAPDYTGAVPRDVIDTGAIAGQTAARLNPALSGLIGGLPEEYQDRAQSTASGIAGLGLPAAKALELYGKQQGDANALITGRLTAEEKRQQDDLQRQQFQERAEMARGKEEFKRYSGAQNMGKEFAAKYDVEARKKAEATHQDVLTLLNNKVKEDDLLALSYLSRLFGERGATSNADAARALGLPATSTWDQIMGWFSTKLEGGIPEPNRSALIGVIQRGIKSNDAELEKFSNRVLELVKDPETDPDVSKGLYDYWRVVVPDKIRAAHEEKRQAAGGQPDRGTSGAATPADVDELDYALDLEASAAGLNTDAIRRVIGIESGGKPDARNASGATGLIQFMPDVAKGLGTSTEELAEMPIEDQVRYVVKYFEQAGITPDSPPEEYYAAVAAGDPRLRGKPDDTVVYPKGSKAWEQNALWRPADGGDITLGSIKAAYGSKGGTKSRAERIAELRRKAAEP